MSIINTQHAMLHKVAESLGELIDKVVFIGGCTTGLFITDDYTKEQVRYTDDVDLIVDIGSYAAWTLLMEKLRTKGFKESADEDFIYRLCLGELKVDFMSTDEKILGFSNRWYKQAVANAQNYPLTQQYTIKLVRPEYFVATKLEAYKGRGNDDALGSHDIEDLINIFDGRPEIVMEITKADINLQAFIKAQLQLLLDDHNLQYAVQSATRNDSGREQLIFERIESCT